MGFQLVQPAILAPHSEIQEGDPRFLAPELLKLPCENPMDLRLCDLYSFGVLLFFLTLGNKTENFQNFIKNLIEIIGKLPQDQNQLENEAIEDEFLRDAIRSLAKREPMERRLF